MPNVLDACAIIALARGESGADRLEEILLENHSTFFIHAVNLCEVYYSFYRASGKSVADELVNDVVTAGIIVRADLDEPFWKLVGELKATLAIPLPDAFASALAQRCKGDVVTGDHDHFDKIAQKGICGVCFFR